MNEELNIDINTKWCKGCELCVEVCPQDVLEMKDFVAHVKDLESCTGCKLCEVLCPDFAIMVHVPVRKRKKSAKA